MSGIADMNLNPGGDWDWARLTLGAVVALLAASVVLPSAGVAAASASGGGVAASVQPTIDAGPHQTGPVANLTITPNPAHPGQAITLDARNSTVPDGTIAYCEFDVDGDGTYDEQVQDCVRTFPYYARGEYDIGVRVVTNGDRTATDTERLVVQPNEAPTAVIDVSPARPGPGESVTLSASASSDGDGTIETYTWQLAGSTQRGETVETAFDAPGNYTVSLTTVDDDGAQNTSQTIVRVAENDAPTATLSIGRTDAVVGESLSLDASGSSDADGQVRRYAWDVDGDGTADRRTETGSIEFVPETAGEFEAQVTVFDDGNASDTATRSYSVAQTDGSAGNASETDNPTGTAGSLPVPGSPGIVPLVPDWVLGAVLLALLGVGGLAVRRRETVIHYAERARELSGRGDVRRRLAKKVSGAAVKKLAKGIVRRFSDLVETGGELVGGGFETVGRVIKRSSQRLATWLRRFAS